MAKKIRYIVVSVIFLSYCFLGSLSYAWWDTTYWDEIRYFAPSWTSDGKICFIKEIKNNSKTENIPWPISLLVLGLSETNNFGEPEYYLCTMDIDGSNKREIAKMPKGYKPEQISWARNNTIVVLSGRIFEKGIEKNVKIAVIIISSAEFKYIANGIMADVSPDGSKIVYVNKGIWISNIDGSNQKIIQNSGTHPLWSPFGEMIAFSRKMEQGKYETVIYISSKATIKTVAQNVGLECWDDINNELWISTKSWQSQSNYNYYVDRVKIDMTGSITVKLPSIRALERIYSPDRKYIVGQYESDKYYISNEEGDVLKTVITYKTINYGKQNRKDNNVWIKD